MLKLKKYLIYTHRYLGLAFCVMFALWFVSGVVMMYKRMPPQQTWLYFDPQLGAVVQKEETRSRIERWLYNGLHSLDFPYLYQSRPAWDITVIVLSIGGCMLSATAIWLAWRRTMRFSRRRRLHVESPQPINAVSE
jgi:uncharacterized membrane protein